MAKNSTDLVWGSERSKLAKSMPDVGAMHYSLVFSTYVSWFEFEIDHCVIVISTLVKQKEFKLYI